jgi:hypothetical protein
MMMDKIKKKMIITNSVQPSELVTRIMGLDHNIKNKPEKITM